MHRRIMIQAGRLIYVYGDELQFLASLGDVTIERASHVEPCGTGWQADMAPVGGPVLGTWTTRAEALQAEVEYLTEHMTAIAYQRVAKQRVRV
jgi:hypothetical protein